MRLIPNLLTLFRLFSPFLILVSLVFFAQPIGFWVAFIVYVAAAVSDFLDGWIARKFEVHSRLGRILDPISDKIFVLGTGIILIVDQAATFGQLDLLLVFPFLLIVIREFLVSGLREALAGQATVHVTWTAKVKTAMQMVAIGLMFLPKMIGHRIAVLTFGMDDTVLQGIFARSIEDELGLLSMFQTLHFTTVAIYVLLWGAAILAWVSALAYFAQAKEVGKSAKT